MIEAVSRPHHTNFPDWAAEKPEVVVLTGDLTRPCELGLFRDRFPERTFSMGMAEQNMIGFAGGMAREGLAPYVHTFGVFIARRTLDQIEMSVAYPNLPVKMLGFLPGISTPGGATHQAIDDMAIMRTLPNMTVLETGDATEVESMLDVAHAVNGPVYVRVLRGTMRRLFPKDEPMKLNQARVLGRGGDVALITSGICTEEALRATQALAERGVGIQHLHISTLKPFDDPAVLETVLAARRGVVTMENHLTTGGLGSAVAEMMTTNGAGGRQIRLGLQDTYAHGATQAYLMRLHGMDARALVGAVEDLYSDRFGVDDEELAEARLIDAHETFKSEAL